MRELEWMAMFPARRKQKCLSSSITVVSLVLCGAAQAADENVVSKRAPVQVQLLRAVEAGRVNSADRVLAQVDVEWKSANCNLRKGAILKGRVVTQKVQSKAQRVSELALLFESGQCNGRDLTPFPLTLVAVLAPDPDRSRSLFEGEQSRPLSDAMGMAAGGGSSIGSTRGLNISAGSVFLEPPRPKAPKEVMPGQVVGLGNIKLAVGTGPEGSSILSSSKHNVRLEIGSQLVLVPTLKTAGSPAKSSTPVSPPPAAAGSAGATQSTELSRTADETEICSPPQCNVALLAADAEASNAKAAATLSINELGYRPGRTREMLSFNHDAAISYLGTQQLLFTFNPHQLVPRTGAESSSDALRIVRGVLIDLKTMKVGHVVDWRVLDAGQYLWPMGQNRVLIHAGNELRMYGPGLELEGKLPLDGPLAYVRASPSAAYLVVGVIQERHTDTTHRELAEAESREPEEDVKLEILDRGFHLLASAVRSSREVPPVLSEEGEIRIPSIGRDRWRIVQYSWDRQRRVLAEFSSTCMPEATSLPPDLLFVVGCDVRTSGKWYRMLQASGKAVLKGWSPSTELEHRAVASPAGGNVAIGIARSAKSEIGMSPFYAADVRSESVAVYSAENGHRQLAVSIPSPLTTHQTFALSREGDQLAVLGGNQVSFYSVPGVTRPQHPSTAGPSGF